MNILVLRSYGDYIVLLNAIKYSSETQPIKIIVSAHLKPLHDALKLDFPINYKFEFINFNISKGILGVFTNKFLFSFSSFKELLILRKYLKNNNVDNYLLEQNKRNLLLKIFTGYNFKYIFRQKNIYDNYISFFKSINITHIVHLISNNSKVLIFPDSRKIEKKINSKTLFNLIDILEAKRIDYTIANYKTKLILNNSFSKNIVYTNFEELVGLIKSFDFIISSDSLPVHISEILNKPHWILYNKQINRDWLTPFSKNAKFYSTFNQVNLLQLIFN